MSDGSVVPSSRAMTQAPTLLDLLERWARERPASPALHGKHDGRWSTVDYRTYLANVRAIGKAVASLGHREGECVAFVGANDPRWVQYQFGVTCARGIPAPIYLTNTREQAAYVVANCKARILVCDGGDQLVKLLSAERDGLFPRLEHILTFGKVPEAAADARIRSFDEILVLGRAQPDDELDARRARIAADDTCILIYTSGTTGVPKGVRISHRGQLVVGEGLVERFPEMRAEGRYHAISYLPLCHQAEQVMTNVLPLCVGGEVSFCPDLQQIKDYLVDVRPTLFLGVPRVWEKFEMALRARLGQATGIRAVLAKACLGEELRCFDEQLRRGRPYEPFTRTLARRLVVDTIKKALGLDRLAVAVTGSAPIAPSTQRFFASLGITIYEAYGLSETSGVATLTDRARPRFGTVGSALRGVEIRISNEGEIQLRGDNNVVGYFEMPDASRELYTPDGWLRTGDLGHLDVEENLVITGRIKELIITAGGKNVAPVEMENYVKSIPGIAHPVVVGDRKPYLGMLITLSPETAGELCRAAGIPERPMAELATDARVRSYLESEIERTCNAKVARYQTIKRFTILPHEFSVEGGELTATMKLKRKPIAEKYAREIEALYAGSEGHS